VNKKTHKFQVHKIRIKKGQVNDEQKIRQTLKPLADSIKGLSINLPLEGEYKIKEKSDNKTVIEVYASDKLFKTLTLELNKNNESGR
jgi:hypothetical protein